MFHSIFQHIWENGPETKKCGILLKENLWTNYHKAPFDIWALYLHYSVICGRSYELKNTQTKRQFIINNFTNLQYHFFTFSYFLKALVCYEIWLHWGIPRQHMLQKLKTQSTDLYYTYSVLSGVNYLCGFVLLRKYVWIKNIWSKAVSCINDAPITINLWKCYNLSCNK